MSFYAFLSTRNKYIIVIAEGDYWNIEIKLIRNNTENPVFEQKQEKVGIMD